MCSAGFEKPSAIQQKGIVPFGKGLDVIQQAQSGTGKTATFCAGILQNLDYNLMECQALVLAPTRELAQQIEKVMRALGDYQQVGGAPNEGLFPRPPHQTAEKLRCSICRFVCQRLVLET